MSDRNEYETEPADMPDESDAKRKYEELRARNKKMKRRMLIVLAAILATLLLLFALVSLLPKLLPDPADDREKDFKFYPPYNGDIFKFDEYLAKYRYVSYCGDPNGQGETTSVTEDNRGDYNAEVLFLCDMLDLVAHGDTEEYNALFSDAYFKTHNAQKNFNQQMIYDATVYFQSAATAGDGSRLATYRVEYKIFRNDGTYRHDMESDAILPQYFVLKVSSDGTIVIDDLYTKYTRTKQ